MDVNTYRERVVPFVGGDGMRLNLIHVFAANKTPQLGPVLLVHGAGVRANIFRAPVEKTIVNALIDAGYDVWLENWRASIEFAPNQWTLDQAAKYDHPYAVQKVIEETGASSIKALIHCQGSTSFTMSAIAGLLPQVDTILSNAVSLHPIVPAISRYKLKLAVPLINRFTDYLNPYWGVDAPNLLAKSAVGLVKLTHHECDNTVCRLVSFTYGTGFPTLWSHENLNNETHEWLKQEFKEVPLRFFRQIYRSVKRGYLVAQENLDGMPKDYAAQPPKTNARFAFFTGQNNVCFLPDSQKKSYEYFSLFRPNYHSLTIVPHYGHLDMFIGKNASKDVFPLMLQALAK